MAKKSKTQQAKASAKRAAKKEEKQAVETVEATVEASETSAKAEVKRAEKKAEAAKSEKKAVKKEEKKAPKKQRFQFLRDVKAELKRVTWPSKQDVIQWSGVVIAALLFFGIFVAILDNLIVTPALVGVSSIEIEGVTPQSEAEIQASNGGAE